MKLDVIGCGYLGAVHAAAMASLGHEVVGINPDVEKIESLRNGRSPFFEPGLDEIRATGLASGRLRFSTSIQDASDSVVHFIAVGTPQLKDGHGADFRCIDSAVSDLTAIMKPGDTVIGKSTVPMGTARKTAEAIRPMTASLAWNPEFLREGFAVRDTVAPDRIVYGVEGETAEQVTDTLDEVYADALGAGTPRIVTNYATAELVKSAANSFLVTKISFINAMGEIAETVGADVVQLADAIGHDERIGRKFLGAGISFGGGCLPKDIRAFTARAEELGRADSISFLREIDEINLRQRRRALDAVVNSFENGVNERRVAVLGLSFKPNSVDISDSPALDVAVQLKGLGADVVAYDPQAMLNAQRVLPQLSFVETAADALRGAEAVVLATEWQEFRDLDPLATAALVSRPLMVDGRNILDPQDWRDAGWKILSMGRSSA